VLVTSGFEENLYQPAGADGILGTLVPREMVLGIAEEVSEDGAVALAPGEGPVEEAVRALIERSARMVVVSLRNADRNPANERRVKTLIQAKYPDRFIRYLPVQLGTEVSPFPGDYERTCTAILNAYIHREMAKTLYRAEDKLRDEGLRAPLLIVHSTGGVHQVGKTVAIQTLNSGPVAAVHGAREWGQAYGFSTVVAMDIGGTSVDVSVIRDGRLPYGAGSEFHGVPLSLPTVAVSAIGAGGGSIASLDLTGSIAVGPRSAGAVPGPACYDRGGIEPTATDADVVLGYLDPEYFLGGKFRLKRDRARRAIQEKLGQPVESVAAKVRRRLQENIAEHIKELLSAGAEPAVLMAFGGAGPLHACGIAELVGIDRVMVCPYASVFSAFGASLLERAHLYMGGLLRRLAPDHLTDAAQEVNRLAEELGRAARRDLANGAGEQILFQLELVVQGTGGRRRLVQVGAASVSNGETLARILVAAGVPGDSARLVGVLLRASVPTARVCPLPPLAATRSDKRSQRPPRPVFWETGNQPLLTPVYPSGLLEPGSVVEGPVLIESEDWVCAVGPAWSYRVDEHRNAMLQRR
jgi:N-methylhydantoinase A/acetophenone carboxylase